MERCAATSFITQEQCPHPATTGEYCAFHAGGWDYFKTNATMLLNVYGQMTTIVGILTPLVSIFGTGKMFSVMSNGQTRNLNPDKMKDTAETLMQSLKNMSDVDDPRSDVENASGTINRLHEDVILLIQHLAVTAMETNQGKNEDLAGAHHIAKDSI